MRSEQTFKGGREGVECLQKKAPENETLEREGGIEVFEVVSRLVARMCDSVTVSVTAVCFTLATIWVLYLIGVLYLVVVLLYLVGALYLA